MKILIIDSHKGLKNSIPQNLHWQNSKILADYLGADLIWSYPTVNDDIKGGYDIIILVHASPYAYTDYKWLEASPNAELFYITNEYNLGEPRTLWMALKAGRKYTVIANHPPEPSKIVMKYVKDWRIVNLNALIYNPISKKEITETSLFKIPRDKCVYYGSFRKDRSKYFTKYLTTDVVLSTHSKNIDKFKSVGATSPIVPRIDWYPKGEGISNYALSLYIEDEKTHIHYNHLANRFYEALNYNCTPIFSVECMETINKSEYIIDSSFIISDPSEIKKKIGLYIPASWHWIAREEKIRVFNEIEKIIKNKK